MELKLFRQPNDFWLAITDIPFAAEFNLAKKIRLPHFEVAIYFCLIVTVHKDFRNVSICGKGFAVQIDRDGEFKIGAILARKVASESTIGNCTKSDSRPQSVCFLME